MTDEHEAMLRELTKLAASVYADTGDEQTVVLVFDRTLIPQLGAGEMIEVKFRRTHKHGDWFPIWDMAGVVTP